MKNLFEAARAEEVKQRIAQMRPDSERQWGTMNPAQALAHCSRVGDGARGDDSAAGVGGADPRVDREADGAQGRRTDAPEFADDRGLWCRMNGTWNGTGAVVRIDRSVCRGRAGGMHHASA